MTTETAPDPIIHDWSNDLEAELVETGMEEPQAKAFARAFEPGMMRVLSVMATKQDLLETKQELFQTKQELKQEFKDGIGNLRSELKDEIANLRREIRFQFVILAGLMAGLMGGIIAKL